MHAYIVCTKSREVWDRPPQAPLKWRTLQEQPTSFNRTCQMKLKEDDWTCCAWIPPYVSMRFSCEDSPWGNSISSKSLKNLRFCREISEKNVKSWRQLLTGLMWQLIVDSWKHAFEELFSIIYILLKFKFFNVHLCTWIIQNYKYYI